MLYPNPILIPKTPKILYPNPNPKPKNFLGETSAGGIKNGIFVTLTPFQKNRHKSMKPTRPT